MFKFSYKHVQKFLLLLLLTSSSFKLFAFDVKWFDELDYMHTYQAQYVGSQYSPDDIYKMERITHLGGILSPYIWGDNGDGPEKECPGLQRMLKKPTRTTYPENIEFLRMRLEDQSQVLCKISKIERIKNPARKMQMIKKISAASCNEYFIQGQKFDINEWRACMIDANSVPELFVQRALDSFHGLLINIRKVD